MQSGPEHISGLLEEAVHTQHKPLEHSDIPGAGSLHVKTVKQRMLVPREEVVKVPVVRKERVKRVEAQVVKGQKLIPRKKFKEVEETVIEVKEEMIDGRIEKRAHPVKRTRLVPYMDYEPEDIEIRVDVPVEEVVTRTGYRHDRHIVSDVVEVEEDHVYELRPVLVRTENRRAKDRGSHHVVKTQHGKPVWDGPAHEGWLGRPITPVHRPELKRLERPTTANSIGSIASAGNAVVSNNGPSSLLSRATGVGNGVGCGANCSSISSAGNAVMQSTSRGLSMGRTSAARNMSSGALDGTMVWSPNYVPPRAPPTMGIRRTNRLDQTGMPLTMSMPALY